MKQKIVLFILFVIAIFCNSQTTISARETLDFSVVVYPGEGEVGSSVVYDDYVVRVNYKYSASNVVIKVCPKALCNNLNTQTYESPETYFDGDHVDFYMADHFTLQDGETYQAWISVSFKPYAAAITDVATGAMNVEFVYEEENALTEEEDPNNQYAEEALTRSERIAKLFRDIIIPCIYVVILIVLIIKGIMLGMDITKYADQPDIRREKIRGFAYFGVALFLLAILNTVGGFVTGLFG
ncbi:MAG: hypothetical protein IKJ30_03660 [Bacilli bacterium]|nr:hypothetical protein [Bacilli bacterium]